MTGATGILPIWYLPLITLLVVGAVILNPHPRIEVPFNIWFLAIAGFRLCGYLFVLNPSLTGSAHPIPLDFMVATIGLMLLLETADQ
jgi:hypothetical protein